MFRNLAIRLAQIKTVHPVMSTSGKKVFYYILILHRNIVENHNRIRWGFLWLNYFIVIRELLYAISFTPARTFSKYIYLGCFNDFEYMYKFANFKPWGDSNILINAVVLPPFEGAIRSPRKEFGNEGPCFLTPSFSFSREIIFIPIGSRTSRIVVFWEMRSRGRNRLF